MNKNNQKLSFMDPNKPTSHENFVGLYYIVEIDKLLYVLRGTVPQK